MSLLSTELERLHFAPQLGCKPEQASAQLVHVMVLALCRPADWSALAPVWRGVQADFALPAPAFAVNGIDGIALWFALAQPVPAADAVAFLEGLCTRYLGAIKPDRVQMSPGREASSQRLVMTAVPVPALQPQTGFWSAFVTSDLAGLFSAEPWLDVPPGGDAQAAVLSQIATMHDDAFHAALQSLTPAQHADMQSLPAHPVGTAQAVGPSTDRAHARQFLVGVMNNADVDLALRIEAAKALLQ